MSLKSASASRLSGRLEELGLTFLASGLDLFLSEQSRKECSLAESLGEFLEIEY